MKLINKTLILGLAGAALAQSDDDARRKRQNKPKPKPAAPARPATPVVELTLSEKIQSNVEIAKEQLALLVNPDDTKEDAIMMKMYEAKIAANGGLSDSLMGTLLAAVSEDDVGIDRNLGCSGDGCRINLSLSGIWEYGCWCSFGPALLNGSGNPVSPHDEFCKAMTQCLRCAEKDTPGCNAITTIYDVASNFNPAGGREALEQACDTANASDPCKTQVCMCETNLLANIVDSVWDGIVYDSTPLHSNNFDVSVCHGNGRAGDPEGPTSSNSNGSEECCGFYPDRVPFSAGNGRQCCPADQVLFSQLDSICCETTGVQLLGNPCPPAP